MVGRKFLCFKNKTMAQKINFNYSSEFYRSRSKYAEVERQRKKRAKARIERTLPKDYFKNKNERTNNDDTN